jgi:mannose-1-phosphate guanylyltransferase/phosphomannomutase
MRRLAEEYQAGENVELLDGIKVFSGDQWVLVIPDAVEPIFHIHSESDSDAASQELVREFAAKIEQMQENV